MIFVLTIINNVNDIIKCKCIVRTKIICHYLLLITHCTLLITHYLEYKHPCFLITQILSLQDDDIRSFVSWETWFAETKFVSQDAKMFPIEVYFRSTAVCSHVSYFPTCFGHEKHCFLN